MNKAQITKRLEQAGIADAGVVNLVYFSAYFASLSGDDAAEDLAQEAIAAHLGGGDVRLMLGRLKHEKRYEVNIESMVSRDEDRSTDEYEVLERKASDNERRDWIPDDPLTRLALWRECRRAIERSYLTRAKQPSGYQAFLCLYGEVAHIGWFPTDKQRARAERAALRKIINWCK